MLVNLSQSWKKFWVLLYYRLVAPTLKIVTDQDILVNDYIGQGRRLLFCIWHGTNFIGIYWFRRRNCAALMEASLKGDVLAYAANFYGVKDFRIKDDTRDPQTVRGTINFIKHLRAGGHGTIALDGPNGPYRIAKPGFVQIARKSGASILPAGIAYARKIVFKRRWDKYQLPLPFSRVALVPGNIYTIPEDLTPEAEEQKYAEIVADVNRCTDEAERILKQK